MRISKAGKTPAILQEKLGYVEEGGRRGFDRLAAMKAGLWQAALMWVAKQFTMLGKEGRRGHLL